MNTEKARAVLPFCGVVRRDERGRPTEVFVPASPTWEDKKRGCPRCAQVSIRREQHEDGNVMFLSCFCRPVEGDGEPEICMGQNPPDRAEGYICYHALAAVMVACDGAARTLFFTFKERKQAEAEANKDTAASLLIIANGHGKAAEGYVVVFPGRLKPPSEADRLKAENEALKARLAEVERKPSPVTPEEWMEEARKPLPPRPPEKCGKCKEQTLQSAEELEAGLCDGCRIVSTEPAVAVAVKVKKRK